MNVAAPCVALTLALGCTASHLSPDADTGLVDAPTSTLGVGDPCSPVATPRCGFASTEVYVETATPACATGACIVYRLAGHPQNRSSEDCPLDVERPDCATATMPSTCIDDETRALPDAPAPSSAERIFCSCRCAADLGRPDAGALCACPPGFSCAPERFCVPTSLLEP